jgi:hypothetical protein
MVWKSMQDDRFEDSGAAGQALRPNREGRLNWTVIEDVFPYAAAPILTSRNVVPEPLVDFLTGDGSHVYAVLDAARVFGLPERLQASGLEHICLYEAEAGLEEVAPWLVSLQTDTPFCQSLFMAGDAPGCLWSREPGIFVRTGMTLADLRRHLRRFTRVTDEAGNSRLFRFWDPRVIGRYLPLHHPDASLHVAAFMSGLEILACDIRRNRALHVVGEPAPTKRPQGHWPYLAHDMEQVRRAIFREDLALRLGRRIRAVGALEESDRKAMVLDMEKRSRRLGLLSDKSVERYCLASLMVGGPAEEDARLAGMFSSPFHELDRSRMLLDAARKLRH